MKQKLFKVMFLLSAIMIALCITACKADETDSNSDVTTTTVVGGGEEDPDPTPHIHDVVIDAYAAPTCTTAGKTEGKHCNTCGKVLAEQENIPATGHTYKDGCCSVCLLSETATVSGACGEHLTWALYPYQTPTVCYALVITGSGEMVDYDPNDLPPWSSYGENIISVSLPDELTYIGSLAFGAITGLKSIEIPVGVESFGLMAFLGCGRSLESITVRSSEGITVDSENPALYTLYAKDNCLLIDGETGGVGLDTMLLLGCKNSIIPNGVTMIAPDAFYMCEDLKSITIPNSVKVIGYDAFGYCTGLTSIRIPENVTLIGETAFVGCSKLVEVWNDSALTITAGDSSNGCVGAYALAVHTSAADTRHVNTTAEGYIFYEDGNTVYLLGYVGTETDLILPHTYNGKAYAIYKGAFYNCSNLTSIEIPASVTSIGDYAFRYCSSLTSLTFADAATWYYTTSSSNWQNQTGGTETDVTNPSTNVTYFTDTYSGYYWYKK